MRVGSQTVVVVAAVLILGCSRAGVPQPPVSPAAPAAPEPPAAAPPVEYPVYDPGDPTPVDETAGTEVPLRVTGIRDTGVPGLLVGLDPEARFVVAFGPQPDYWLTLTRLDDPSHPTVLAKIATASAAVVPGTEVVAFTGGEREASGVPVHIVKTDGTGLTRIGTTDTPFRLQVTTKGLVAFRSGSDLVVYDVGTGASRALEGVVLQGAYPDGDTEWAISPDATRVALQDGSELTLLDLKTGARRTVTRPPDMQRETPGVWSPDGALFAYGTSSYDRPVRPALWVASPETAERRVCVPDRQGSRDVFESIRWLDGTTLLTSYVPSGPKPDAYPNTRYYAVTLEGAVRRLFTGGEGLFVTADGKSIWFWRPGKEMYTQRPTLWTGTLSR